MPAIEAERPLYTDANTLPHPLIGSGTLTVADKVPPLERSRYIDVREKRILAAQGADPYIFFDNGTCYSISTKNFGKYPRKKDGNSQLLIKSSHRLRNINQGQETTLWAPSEYGEIWAPEIHQLYDDSVDEERWFVYAAACKAQYNTKGERSFHNKDHRNYVLRSETPDLFSGYELMGYLHDPEADYWSIDATVFKYNGKLYTVYSGWEYNSAPPHIREKRIYPKSRDQEQLLYIAELETPWKMKGHRVEISRPQFDYETSRGRVNEGPSAYIDKRTNKLTLAAAANGSWSGAYCTFQLILKDGGNPLNKADWLKTGPIKLIANGSGHGMVVNDPEEGLLFVHHALPEGKEGWEQRYICSTPLEIAPEGVWIPRQNTTNLAS